MSNHNSFDQRSNNGQTMNGGEKHEEGIGVNQNNQYIDDPTNRRDEEISSELLVDDRGEGNEPTGQTEDMRTNSVSGWVGLAFSILSFFFMPFLLGIIGIILGFVARSRDAEWLGNAAITAGVISILISLFVSPFV